MTSIDIKKRDGLFIKNVLDYYKKYGRHNLAWRKRITAYAVLVSEVMLQQTQVSRVEPKFKQWLKAYPTLGTLNKATFKEVLILWQGLGYQRRAKALHDIARSVQKLPTTFEELLVLPGVGMYTASAVCAFAYNIFSHPVLETNIRTALIEQYHYNVRKVHDDALYDDLSRLEKNTIVRNAGARTWYYALMDYGAHLKQSKISHNTKSSHYAKQSPYKGSTRELRAKILFAIAHNEKLPLDARTEAQVQKLSFEGYITQKGRKYDIKN